MSFLAARRRHPAAIVIVLLFGLIVTGGLYAVLAPGKADAAAKSASDIKAGRHLFLSNCATCHGINATGGDGGPSLVGVGAAAVDFQVGTGRMPLPAPGVQAERGKVHFTKKEISQLAAYVASLGPGPAIPDEKWTSGGGDIAKGGELFRVNCAMCHNFAGAGGALTRGKFAPSLMDVNGRHMFEAMETGPQSMPVFSNSNLSKQDKKDIISFLKHVQEEPNQGGFNTGSMGPVPEGLFAWTIGIGLLVGAAVWLGRKAA